MPIPTLDTGWTSYPTTITKPLSSDQFIFPSITSKTADLHFTTPLSVECVNQFLEEFGKSANIGEGFTSHCFHHGGIQYRFLFAPVQECWTLDQCHCCSGWANNESVSTHLVNHLFPILMYLSQILSSSIC